ncbi:MAG: hypothetical protein KZQ88_18415, partial [Candidatus Thiodiazotropha sp. (ex Dulcina madagascariensis)]|nr:hypothetical protein [Candidatus Thiodiazotropha sp. (ex Dulcina madagascariensis)]
RFQLDIENFRPNGDATCAASSKRRSRIHSRRCSKLLPEIAFWMDVIFVLYVKLSLLVPI